jgi:hypothetical protein
MVSPAVGQQIAAPEIKGAEAMATIQKERWVELCEQIAVERNPQKMIELTLELNRILSERINSPHKSRSSSTLHEESST